MKKFLLIVTAVFILIVAAAATWAYFAFFYTKSLTQTELNAITPDWTKATDGNWSPWFTEIHDPAGTKIWNPTASFNQWLNTVPEKDKAWPIIIDVTLANPEIFKHEALGDYPNNSEHWNQITTLIESEKGQDAIIQLKDALTRPVLGCGMYSTTGTYEHQARLRHGLKDDNWNPNPHPNPNGFRTILPALGPLRNNIKFIKSVAMYELTNNNPDEFVELVDVMHTSAQLAGETPFIISQLVKIAIEATAIDLIMWALEQHPDSFTDQHLAEFSSIIERAGIQTLTWEGEALFFQDTLRRTVDGKGPVNPSRINILQNGSQYTPTNFPNAQLHPSLQRLFYVHAIIGKQTQLRSQIPWDPALESSRTIYNQQKDSLNKVSQTLMDTMLPAMGQAAAAFQAIAQESIGTRTLIALHRHKLRHGHFPQTLDDLDQDFITIEPMDIFTGNQLKYTLTDDGPMLYALGQDRDDDNGRYTRDVKSITLPIDADWPMFSRHKLNKLYPDD